MIETIERLAREHLWRVHIEKRETNKLVEAAINKHNWSLRFTLDPDANTLLQKRGLKAAQLPVLAEGLVAHEIGHWEICPFDSDGAYVLTEAIVQSAGSRIIARPDGERKIHFLMNIVADIIVDTVRAYESEAHATAHALFFLKELREEDCHLSSVYELFVRLNLDLWGNRSSETCQEVLQCLSEENHLEKQLQEALDGFPHRDKPALLTKWLRNRKNWAALAKTLAPIFARLMENASESVKVFTRKQTREDDDWDLEWWLPSPFDKVLSILYEGRGAKLALALQVPHEHGMQWPVSPLLVKPVDPMYSPDIEHVNWNNTRLWPTAGKASYLELHWNEHYIEMPWHTRQRRVFLPDLSFWVDSSGSMGFEPYPGKGKYDLVLRAAFGVFRWLENQHIAPYLNYSVLNFSKETIYSGWQAWSQRHLLYETLFKYQGSITRLNTGVVDRLLSEAPRKFVTIMITDGSIENDESVIELIRKGFTISENFVFIQLGKRSELADALDKLGFTVYDVKNPEDLCGLTIRTAKERFTSLGP